MITQHSIFCVLLVIRSFKYSIGIVVSVLRILALVFWSWSFLAVGILRLWVFWLWVFWGWLFCFLVNWGGTFWSVRWFFLYVLAIKHIKSIDELYRCNLTLPLILCVFEPSLHASSDERSLWLLLNSKYSVFSFFQEELTCDVLRLLPQ